MLAVAITLSGLAVSVLGSGTNSTCPEYTVITNKIDSASTVYAEQEYSTLSETLTFATTITNYTRTHHHSHAHTRRSHDHEDHRDFYCCGSHIYDLHFRVHVKQHSVSPIHHLLGEFPRLCQHNLAAVIRFSI